MKLVAGTPRVPLGQFRNPGAWVRVNSLGTRGVLATEGRNRGWLWWILLSALAGYLLFNHGCHADEDTELLVSAGAIRPPEAKPITLGPYLGTSIGIG